VTIVVAALQAAARIPDNEVSEFLTIQVLYGDVRVTTPDGDIDMKEKNMVIFHPGVVHTVQALSDAILLITTNKDAG
jgi:quercetin dioxygenase-like cupin family protein